jgi:hypothetical protein
MSHEEEVPDTEDETEDAGQKLSPQHPEVQHHCWLREPGLQTPASRSDSDSPDDIFFGKKSNAVKNSTNKIDTASSSTTAPPTKKARSSPDSSTTVYSVEDSDDECVGDFIFGSNAKSTPKPASRRKTATKGSKGASSIYDGIPSATRESDHSGIVSEIVEIFNLEVRNDRETAEMLLQLRCKLGRNNPASILAKALTHNTTARGDVKEQAKTDRKRKKEEESEKNKREFNMLYGKCGLD